MNKDTIYENFVEILKERIPERGKLSTMLADMLLLEKEAVYRRLRGEVPFSFSEVAIIASQLDISLDNIVGNTSSKSRSLQMRLIDFENSTDADYTMQLHYANMLEKAKEDPDSEAATVANQIPINLCIEHNQLYKFHRLKWLYQFGRKPVTFKDVVVPDRIKEMNVKTIRETKEIGKTYYVWDEKVINSLVSDILYFASIRLIEKEEVAMLKEDLRCFLDKFEKMTMNGQYDTGKEVYVFIASVSFETGFSYIQTKDYCLTDIRTFTLNDTISLDKQVFEMIKKWTQSLIRTSTLISGSNEVQRIMFFDNQRKIVEAI